MSTPLISLLRDFAFSLGASALSVSDIDMSAEDGDLSRWLAAGFHGGMDYMAKNRELRASPELLVPGAKRVISVAFPYLPESNNHSLSQNHDASKPLRFISKYALGRDYHKLLRKQLKKLAERIGEKIQPHHYRVFADSAPIAEVALAARGGLGFRGKNTLLIAPRAGSFFFIGDILTDLELPVTPPIANHCGSCERCLKACPTQALVAPYCLDARRCVSYLTIELKTSIPVELRPLMGTRVFGCDECQDCCPWNRFAKTAALPDWKKVRECFAGADLVELFSWDEESFLKNTEGSPIRRAGYERWLRNLAVALGNAARESSDAAERERYLAALRARRDDPSEMVREHVEWALNSARTFNNE